MEKNIVKKLLKYDRLTGVFVWRTGARKGRRAGTLTNNGYRKIVINKQEYLEHRLAVLYVNGCLPVLDVDHMNCQRADNRWANLRVVDRQTNSRNRNGCNKNNRSGFIGAHEYRKGKWAAQISLVAGSKLHLGVFKFPEAANTMYMMAKEFYFGNH
jgi:hypothetical protein